MLRLVLFRASLKVGLVLFKQFLVFSQSHDHKIVMATSLIAILQEVICKLLELQANLLSKSHMQ